MKASVFVILFFLLLAVNEVGAMNIGFEDIKVGEPLVLESDLRIDIGEHSATVKRGTVVVPLTVNKRWIGLYVHGDLKMANTTFIKPYLFRPGIDREVDGRKVNDPRALEGAQYYLNDVQEEREKLSLGPDGYPYVEKIEYSSDVVNGATDIIRVSCILQSGDSRRMMAPLTLVGKDREQNEGLLVSLHTPPYYLYCIDGYEKLSNFDEDA